MRIYEEYSSETYSREKVAGRAFSFSVSALEIVRSAGINQAQHPNPEWSDRYHKIRKANGGKPRNSVLRWHASKIVRKGSKRIRVEDDPDEHTELDGKVTRIRIRTSFTKAGYLSNLQSSAALGNVNDIEDLVKKLDDIYIPDQRMLAIDDPLLQKYITLRSDDEAGRARLDRQLGIFFHEQLENINSGQKTSEELSEMLGRLSSYTRYSKVGTTSD